VFLKTNDPTLVQHELSDLIAQRLYGLVVQGYEDRYDPASSCVSDPMFGIAVGKLESENPRCKFSSSGKITP